MALSGLGKLTKTIILYNNKTMTEIKRHNCAGRYEAPGFFAVSLIESESVALSSPSDWVDSDNFNFKGTHNVYEEEL